MAMLRGTRIRFPRLLIHLVSGDLADGIDEGGESYDRCSLEAVDLVLSTCVVGLLLRDLDGLKSLMATASALGLWSLGGTCTNSSRFSST
jgi:hypothetical protein